MKVLTVLGARPQFIKAAPVSRALRRSHEEFLVHTGQHYDDAMSDLFFRQLGIPAPDVNLEIGSGAHGAQTGAMLAGIEAVAIEQRPDRLLVYGDTNSTLAGALAGAKLHIPIAHVEAGLRSHDRRMPEEVNRVVTDHLSDLLLCPGQVAVGNLAREGIAKGVHVVGDVMFDAFCDHLETALGTCTVLGDVGLEPGSYQLLTAHRAENVDDPGALARIMRGVDDSGCQVVFGVQKEAYFAGRPCITLRDSTEWTETVACGWNVLVGTDPRTIAEAMRTFRPTGGRPQLFGDGRAAERIVDCLGQ
ncbi:MAG: UDP-N-acetyl glucosamine 2-epimerase [Actinobacteria bacterium 13_2_20CM_2_66_6]|nr:MAG: UDP-N-acetyl glucosamine 2-epimerase [Actinobacteria bacterium 13_2_20CM_2_66_6]